MKQDIENIIRTNLPEEVDDDGFAHDPSVAFNNGFDEALSQINTSLIADEVLKVVVEKIDKMKGLGNYGQGCTDPIEWNIGYNQAIKDLLSNLSPNKENE